MSLTIAEEESIAMGPELVKGSYAAWNYFQTLDNPENAKFIAAYQAKYGADKVTSDPIRSPGTFGFEKSTEPDAAVLA